MEPEFSGQTVMVTGASGGIGQQIAKQFAERGARLVLHYYKNREAVEQTLADFSGRTHLIVQADFRSSASVCAMAEKAISKMGQIRILVNNAGILELHPVATTAFDVWQESWNKTILTNLVGPAHLTFHLSRHMMRIGGGRIINITSRGAFRGVPEATAYAASKAGLNAFSQSMAVELGRHNIFVYTVAPGFVKTDLSAAALSGPEGDKIRAQSPLNRVARPEEIARVVLFLASEGSEYLTGSIIDINGASYLRA